MIASTGECAKIWKRGVLYHVLKDCHCLPDSVSLQAEKEPAEGRIAANLATAKGTHVSARNNSQRLNQVGLYARKPVRCTPFNYAIVERDYAGIMNALVRITRCSPANIVSV
ncbi:hypothetical protein TNCV_4818311 [Trichonephila clavipes]|nr:hypothetical protein TNCV_4818311 [Trichonephila clavipes]